MDGCPCLAAPLPCLCLSVAFFITIWAPCSVGFRMPLPIGCTASLVIVFGTSCRVLAIGDTRRSHLTPACLFCRCGLTPTGTAIPLGIHPSNVQIVKLHLDKDRKALLERKNRAKQADEKVAKVSAEDVAMTGLD